MKNYLIIIAVVFLLSVPFQQKIDGNPSPIPSVHIDNCILYINTTIEGINTSMAYTSFFNTNTMLINRIESTFHISNGILTNSTIIIPEKYYNKTSEDTTGATYEYHSFGYFAYRCTSNFSDVNIINVHKLFEMTGESYDFVKLNDMNIYINSNANVTVSFENYNQNGKNHHIICTSNQIKNGVVIPIIRINSDCGNGIGFISDSFKFNAYRYHHPPPPSVNKVVLQEDIDVNITYLGEKFCWNMVARIWLDKDLFSSYHTDKLWFPDNCSDAIVILFTRDYNGQTHTDRCIINFGIQEGQKGFMINLPYIYDVKEICLLLWTNGVTFEPHYDYIISIRPSQDSTFNITVPAVLNLTYIQSGFEKVSYINESKNTTIQFSGNCIKAGLLQIGWEVLPDNDGDGIPNEKDKYPDDPNNNGSVIDGFILPLIISILLVYISILTAVSLKKKHRL